VNDENKLIDLMIGYQAGRMDAFEELYALTKPMLRRFLILKCMNRLRAEELLQETFLQIHRSRHTYLPEKPVTPWIFAIAHHVFTNDRRANRRREAREESIEDHSADLPVPPDMEAAVEASELRKALAHLPEDQREAMVLHYYWGFNFRDIGAILGIGAGTAKLRSFRGLIKARQYLSPPSVTKLAAMENTHRENMHSE
jgi:RNA polymerase sigma-70 factor (ECF subfamily)